MELAKNFAQVGLQTTQELKTQHSDELINGTPDVVVGAGGSHTE